MQPDLYSTIFWQRLAPYLSTNEYFQAACPIIILPDVLGELSHSMEQNSYFQLHF